MGNKLLTDVCLTLLTELTSTQVLLCTDPEHLVKWLLKCDPLKARKQLLCRSSLGWVVTKGLERTEYEA